MASTDREATSAGTGVPVAYLDLAREIHAEIQRVAADDAATIDMIEQAVRRVPERERDKLALDVFDRLPAEQQWAVIERVFGDEELRAHLEGRRAALVERERRDGPVRGVLDAARRDGRLDLDAVPVGATLALGLFVERDVAAAVVKGHTSATCARRLVLRSAEEPGAMQVIEDVFNPEGGYFVTGDYDQRAWAAERLPAHAVVRVGSIVDTAEGPRFEPVLYPAGRVDIDRDGEQIAGRLHLGFAMLMDRDVFAD